MLTDVTFVSVQFPIIFSWPISYHYNPYTARLSAIYQLQRKEVIGIRTPDPNIDSLGIAIAFSDKMKWEPAIAFSGKIRAMSIIKLISIGKFILAIYYTKSDCYKYSIIDEGGVVLESDDIFWTPDAAEQEGREAINTVSS